MALSSDKKESIIKEYAQSEGDTGSPEVQVALFSETMPDALNSLTEKFMRDTIKILVKAEQLTLEGIEQYYIALESDDQKYDTLKDLYGIKHDSIKQSRIIPAHVEYEVKDANKGDYTLTDNINVFETVQYALAKHEFENVNTYLNSQKRVINIKN